MMVVARGIAGFGAGGEYPVCATNATEAADKTAQLRKRRGFLVAATADFAVDLVCHIDSIDVGLHSSYNRDSLPQVWLLLLSSHAITNKTPRESGGSPLAWAWL